jgi:hypothetical protein
MINWYSRALSKLDHCIGTAIHPLPTIGNQVLRNLSLICQSMNRIHVVVVEFCQVIPGLSGSFQRLCVVEDCILDFADVNHGLWIAGIWKGQKEVGVSETTKTDQKK